MTLDSRKRKNRRKSRYRRVWLNGIEITKRCFYADGRRGIARCYIKDKTGFLKYELRNGNSELAIEELRGKIRWGWV